MVMDLSTNITGKAYSEAEIKQTQDVLGAIMRDKKAGMFCVIEKVTNLLGQTSKIEGPSGVYEMSISEVDMVCNKMKEGHKENVHGGKRFEDIIAGMPSETLGDLLKEFLKRGK